MVNHIRHELRVGLRLIPPAHDAERHVIPSFAMKPGMIVCSGRLRGASTFGCGGVEREEPATVLQREPEAIGHDAQVPKFAKLLWMSDTVLPWQSTDAQVGRIRPALGQHARRDSGVRAPRVDGDATGLRR